MIDISKYNFLNFEQFSKDIFSYFKDNSKLYDLNPNQIVGHNNERPAGGLIIDIYLSDYTPEQGEQPSPFFLDEANITIELVLLGVGKSTADKSYYTLTDRTARLALVASKIDNYLCEKGYDTHITQVKTFQAVQDAIKASDILNNACSITLLVKLFSEIQ